MSDLSANEIKNLSGRIIRLLPDDPCEALTVLAISYANAVVATGCDDEGGIEAIRCALKQMRVGDWWKDS